MLSNLPSEIFDVIAEAVILHEDLPPPDIATAAANRRDEAVLEAFFDAKVITQRGPIASNSAGLLRSSRALAMRTRGVLERLRQSSPSGLSLKLDVLIVGERELWTTWTHIPTLQRPVVRLDVCVRIADGHTIGKQNGWNTASTGPAPLIYCFYFLLRAFLNRGPMFDAVREAGWGTVSTTALDGLSDHDVIVHELNIDASALDESKIVPDDMYSDWNTARRRVLWHDVKPVTVDSATRQQFEMCLAPERLLQRLDGSYGFGYMLDMYEPEYGAILYERLGKMMLSIGDTVWRTFDLGASFAGLVQRPTGPDTYYRPKSDFFGQGPASERPAKFALWWYETRARRLQHRMPGGDATDEGADIPSLEDAQAQMSLSGNVPAVTQEDTTF